MKAILISEVLEPEEKIKPILDKYGFDLIHYRSPLKAMDNLTEISPDALIINAIDFPRHWKVISQHIRWDKPKESVLLILLTDSSFSKQDQDKASESGIQAMLPTQDNFLEVLPEIKKVFDKYKTVSVDDSLALKNDAENITSNLDKEKASKDYSSRVKCVFVNPNQNTVVTGIVKDITEHYMVFSPDFIDSTNDMEENSIIDDLILQINANQIISKCCLKSNAETMEFSFIELSEKDKELISSVQ